MSWSILVRPEAERDVTAACDWYDERVAGLGNEFLDEFSDAMFLIEEHPERTPL